MYFHGCGQIVEQLAPRETKRGEIVRVRVLESIKGKIHYDGEAPFNAYDINIIIPKQKSDADTKVIVLLKPGTVIEISIGKMKSFIRGEYCNPFFVAELRDIKIIGITEIKGDWREHVRIAGNFGTYKCQAI